MELRKTALFVCCGWLVDDGINQGSRERDEGEVGLANI